MSISPDLSVSRIASAFCRRGGWSRNCRLSSPQFLRNLITFASSFTALTISSVLSEPPPSVSIIWKHSRAAFLNSFVNSSISFAARAASSERLAARSASLFLSAISMHSSLGEQTGEPRNASTLSRRRRWRTSTPQALPKVSDSEKRTTRRHQCARRGPCPSRSAPRRGAPAPTSTASFCCRSSRES